MQRPFLEWLGCDVVGDYGRFEETTPERLAKLMDTAKARGVVLVVDNLQSTGAAGASLAEDLGAGHAVLSNFPGGYPEAPTWEQTADRNLALLRQAVPAKR